MSSNSNSYPNEWHRLCNAALNDTLTAEEAAQLASLLKSSADARQLWFLYNDNECSLSELKSAPALPAATQRRAPASKWRTTWSPFTAAAAGLVMGLFSASIVWGYVGTMSQRVTTLLAESFESGNAPLVTGFPVTAGVWSGDYSEVVSESQGVHPKEGRKMLRFRQADYEGKPVRDGYVADLFRIVDLHAAGAAGDSTVAVEAHFAALPQGELEGLSCGMTIYALDALPPETMRDDLFLKRAGAGLAETLDPDFEPRILASATRSEKAPSDGRTWTAARSEMRLPSDARYCLIHLRMHLRGSHREEVSKPVAFEGLFLDDIRMTLTQSTAAHP